MRGWRLRSCERRATGRGAVNAGAWSRLSFPRWSNGRRRLADRAANCLVRRAASFTDRHATARGQALTPLSGAPSVLHAFVRPPWLSEPPACPLPDPSNGTGTGRRGLIGTISVEIRMLPLLQKREQTMAFAPGEHPRPRSPVLFPRPGATEPAALDGTWDTPSRCVPRIEAGVEGEDLAVAHRPGVPAQNLGRKT